MFTWLAILCCHLVCYCGRKKSPCKSYKGKKRSKKGKRSVHQMTHGKAVLKPGIGKNSQIFQGHCHWAPKRRFTAPHMNPWLQEANMLMHIGLWPMALKLNHSWTMEVNKSAWIKPCANGLSFHDVCAFHRYQLIITNIAMEKQECFTITYLS